jgi:hypothetical protein
MDPSVSEHHKNEIKFTSIYIQFSLPNLQKMFKTTTVSVYPHIITNALYTGHRIQKARKQHISCSKFFCSAGTLGVSWAPQNRGLEGWCPEIWMANTVEHYGRSTDQGFEVPTAVVTKSSSSGIQHRLVSWKPIDVSEKHVGTSVKAGGKLGPPPKDINLKMHFRCRAKIGRRSTVQRMHKHSCFHTSDSSLCRRCEQMAQVRRPAETMKHTTHLKESMYLWVRLKTAHTYTNMHYCQQDITVTRIWNICRSIWVTGVWSWTRTILYTHTRRPRQTCGRNFRLIITRNRRVR